MSSAPSFNRPSVPAINYMGIVNNVLLDLYTTVEIHRQSRFCTPTCACRTAGCKEPRPNIMTDETRGDPAQPQTVGAVLVSLFRHPVDHFIRRWNWKSALLSSLLRGAIFFCTNLLAGWHAALGAMLAEFVFRTATSGFYGSLTQAFRKAKPRWAATAATMVLLPMVSHSLEFMVHWLRGTPKLGLSIASSMIFTAVSTAFNLYAMRKGALIVGDGHRPLAHDLKVMPGLILSFLIGVPRAIFRGLRRMFRSISRRRSSRLFRMRPGRGTLPRSTAGQPGLE